MNFNDILSKKECTEAQYEQYKELFDNAVESGLISKPEKFEKSKISSGRNGNVIDIQYSYKWEIKDNIEGDL